MICPKCHSGLSKVVDKRNSRNNMSIRRRRECLNCSFRFTTYEALENNTVLVRKKSGKLEEFNRDKLKNSLLKGLRKRPINEEAVDKFLDQVEMELSKSQISIVDSKQIGEKVLNWLKELDKVAYMLYAIVYRDFDNVTEIQTELTNLNT